MEQGMRAFNTIMVSGGAGFVGSNFIRHIFTKREFTGRIVNVDALTQSGNPLSLRDVEEAYGTKRYIFERADICDRNAMDYILKTYGVECIVHFAAESYANHFNDPSNLITTNIQGTFTLLEAARACWGTRRDVLFHHVSTDEVFGAHGASISENAPYGPHTPYAASKAAGDHLVRAWHHTYDIPVTISNASGNYGPYHFPEELIPRIIINALDNKALPIYGREGDVRDWLYVADHAEAIRRIIAEGRIGETYNIGGETRWRHIDLVKHICATLARATNRQEADFRNLISFVEDAADCSPRHALNCGKIKKELGWKQSVDFDKGLELTVRWYLDNQAWVEEVRSGEHVRWVEKNYGRKN
jgi:dTDP-glucose 4,6-dehydratase